MYIYLYMYICIYIYICIVMLKYDFFYSQVGEVSQWGEMGIVRIEVDC